MHEEAKGTRCIVWSIKSFERAKTYRLHVLHTGDSFSLAQFLDKMLKVRVDFNGKPFMFSRQRPLSVQRIKVEFGIFSLTDFLKQKIVRIGKT